MAFPTAGILDAATGAGPTTPPSANWSQIGGATANLTLEANQIRGLNTAYNGSYWNVATFGPDCEARFPLTTRPSGNAQVVSLFLRTVDPGSTTLRDGYVLEVTRVAGNDEWRIYSVTNNVSTQLGATATQETVDGGEIGFEAIGTTLKGYYHNGSSWSEILSRTDSTYTGAGYIGMLLQQTAARANDFGGGTVVAASPPVNTVAPAVTGNQTVGETLSCTTGTWTGDVSSGYAYAWKRDGVAIGSGDATDDGDYTLLPADVGHDITCTVTATGTGGSTAATSNALLDIGPLYEFAIEEVGFEFYPGPLTIDYSIASPAGTGTSDNDDIPHPLAPLELQTLGPPLLH